MKRRGGDVLTRHADTSESPRIVQAGTVVLAGMRLALVHVRLASRPGESLRAIAREGPGGVHTDPVVLAGRACKKEKERISLLKVDQNKN